MRIYFLLAFPILTIVSAIPSMDRDSGAPSLYEIIDEDPDLDICDDEHVILCQTVDLHYDVLNLESFEAFNLTFNKDHEIENAGPSDSISIFYEGPDDVSNAIITSMNVENISIVYGKFNLESAVYKLKDTFDGDHVLIQSNSSGLLFNDTQVLDRLSNRRAISSSQKVPLNDRRMDTFSLILYYTRALRNREGNMQVYFDQYVAELNEGYRITDIPIRAKIHCIVETPLNEAYRNQYSDVLSAVWRLHGSSIRSVLNTADLAIIQTRFSHEGNCGRVHDIGPNPSVPLGFVADECENERVFDHEIGHLLGACHNREEGSGGPCGNYGYGVQIPNTNYRTIMSYNSDGSHYRVVGAYSTPTLTLNGNPIGNAWNDNRRQIWEGRRFVSNLGDESKTCSDGPPPCSDDYSWCPYYVNQYCRYSWFYNLCKRSCGRC